MLIVVSYALLSVLSESIWYQIKKRKRKHVPSATFLQPPWYSIFRRIGITMAIFYGIIFCFYLFGILPIPQDPSPFMSIIVILWILGLNFLTVGIRKAEYTNYISAIIWEKTLENFKHIEETDREIDKIFCGQKGDPRSEKNVTEYERLRKEKETLKNVGIQMFETHTEFLNAQHKRYL